jgi:L-ascorbate metabolism protein UlaG (beta-lactamase superfamily)
MRITKYGHACLLLEEGKARILIDPGAYSKGFEGLENLSAVLITHSHADHMKPEHLQALRRRNPTMEIYVDAGSGDELKQQAPDMKVKVVYDKDVFEVDGVPVKVEGEWHAEIHKTIPQIPNVAYLVAKKFYYPGDSFTKPTEKVEVLGLPIGAPWSKVSEVIDYVLAVKPKIAIPVHDAVLAMPDMYAGIVGRFTEPEGIELRVVPNGESIEV